MSVTVTGEQDADGRRVRLEVADTGIGMSEAERDRVFEAFSQADSSITRQYGGTGLGLTISRRLARRMGGGIEVESAPGRGSTFVVTLPVDCRAELVEADLE